MLQPKKTKFRRMQSILFEAEGVPLAVAQEALRLGAQKLPITTKFIVRRDYVETTI